MTDIDLSHHQDDQPATPPPVGADDWVSPYNAMVSPSVGKQDILPEGRGINPSDHHLFNHSSKDGLLISSTPPSLPQEGEGITLSTDGEAIPLGDTPSSTLSSNHPPTSASSYRIHPQGTEEDSYAIVSGHQDRSSGSFMDSRPGSSSGSDGRGDGKERKDSHKKNTPLPSSLITSALSDWGNGDTSHQNHSSTSHRPLVPRNNLYFGGSSAISRLRRRSHLSSRRSTVSMSPSMRTSVGGEIPKERKAVRPTVQVFLFANPKSGDRRGRHLIDLEVQHFRLKESPEVQIQIYNILDQTSREEGMRLLKYILHRRAGEAECEVHVWSAGGDGTVTSVLDLLLDPHWDIDPSEVFFSCIPFGTGNDFSQVLGWGRTVEKSDVLGKHLEELARIASSRVTNADSGKAYMDIWEVDIATYPNGRLRRVGAPEDEKNGRLSRRMTNYFTIGVQGYVGRGFEGSRARSRFANACIYARESMKWLIFRKFPPVTRVWSGIRQPLPPPQSSSEAQEGGGMMRGEWNGKPWDEEEQEYETVLTCVDPDSECAGKVRRLFRMVKARWKKGKASKPTRYTRDANGCSIQPSYTPPPVKPTKEEMELVEKLQGRPTLLNNPIEVVVQNIPHIWGRNVDLWGDSPETADTVMPQQGPTDPSEWTPQTASDGKLEIFSFSSVWSYIKKLGLRFDHLSRVGQFGDCELTFRQGGTSNMGHWVGRRRRHEKVTCFMIDGEFYEVKDPKYVRFRRNGQIRLVGNSAEAAKARLVRDTRCEDLHAASLPINLAHLASGAGRNSASPASSSHAHHPSMENPIAIPALIDNEGQPVLPFDPNHMDSHDGGSSSS